MNLLFRFMWRVFVLQASSRAPSDRSETPTMCSAATAEVRGTPRCAGVQGTPRCAECDSHIHGGCGGQSHFLYPPQNILFSWRYENICGPENIPCFQRWLCLQVSLLNTWPVIVLDFWCCYRFRSFSVTNFSTCSFSELWWITGCWW